MRWKKITTGMLIALFVISIANGCAKNSQVKEKETVAMGRYIEKTIDMPEAVKSGKELVYRMIRNTKGKIEIYVHLKNPKKNEKTVKYTLDERYRWKRTVLEWIDQEKEELVNVCYSPGGNLYAIITRIIGNKKIKAKIIKSSDEEHFEQVDFEPFKKNVKYNEIPSSFSVLKDNSILFAYGQNIKVYENSKVRTVFKIGEISYAISDNKMFASNEKTDAVRTINLNDGKPVSEIPISGIYGSLTTDKDGNLYVISKEGIQRSVKGGSCWETVLDGAMASMCSPSYYATDIITGDKKDIYVLYGGVHGYQEIKYYVYDKNIPATPSQTLSIVSIWENPTVKDAIANFQHKNPYVKVDYADMSDEKGMTKTDAIKTINTELLEGKGADLILLDGMPVESYIEKGVLADISDVIEPLVQNGDLLKNIVEPYKINGKILEVPLRYNISYMFGNKEAVKAAKSIQTLGDYAKTAKIPLFGANEMDYGYLTGTLYRTYSGSFLGKDKKINKTGLITFLENLKIIGEQTKVLQTEYSPGEQAEPYNDKQAKSLYYKKALLGLSELYCMYDMYLPSFILDKVGGKYSAINGQFTPYGLLGLNNASKQKKLAKEFIKELYSYPVQNIEESGGFPVNTEALEKYSVGDMPYVFDNIEVTQPSKEKMQEILDLCKKVTTPTSVDETLLDMIQNETKSYLKGNADVNSTADKIIQKAKPYLNE